MSASTAPHRPASSDLAPDLNTVLNKIGRDFSIDCDWVGVAAEYLAEIVAERPHYGEITVNEMIHLLERCAPRGRV